MKKKIALSLIALVAVVGGVAGMSAYEAHVINVTAHIENALSVATKAIEFGTVFPQEYVEADFTISLSESFLAAERVDDVEYVIKQKPKCICDSEEYANETLCPEGKYAAVGYATHACPDLYHEMENLCQFLSKVDGDPEDQNDISHQSYYVEDASGDYCVAPVRYTSSPLNYSQTGWGGWSCPAGTHAVGGGVIENTFPMGAQGIAEPGATIGGSTYPVFPHWTFSPGETGYVAQNGGTSQTCKIYVDCLANNPDATGLLTKVGGDVIDLWIVDLKVPPVEGFVGQDWPAGCPTVPTNDVDYGCDLWIEVTGVSEVPVEPEPYCGDGIVNGNEACEVAADCPVGIGVPSCNLPGTVLECQCKYSVEI